MTRAAKDRRYDQSPKGRLRHRRAVSRYEASPTRRRYKLVYNRTARYSRATDRFIERQEAKGAYLPTD